MRIQCKGWINIENTFILGMNGNPSLFNIPGGLLGIGEDLMLELIHEMRSLRDVENVFPFFIPCRQTHGFFRFSFSHKFLVLNRITYDLIKHERFSWAVDTGFYSHFLHFQSCFHSVTLFSSS